MEAVIVGAGTFGASLAWWLARSGVGVTLVDQFGPGDPRASSGGETRLYRCAHGPDAEYTAMARRARTMWRQLEDESGEELLLECGMAWFAHRDEGWEAAPERILTAQGIPVERLEVDSAARVTQASAVTISPSSFSSPREGCFVRNVRCERLRRRRSPTVRGLCVVVRALMVQPWSWKTRLGSKVTSSCGHAARGFRSSSPRSSR